ncbi:MAG: hypothetical protein FJ098_10010, partial [Deltaproteobacteria bacterium]|nr:hypothetical protein [Deltaproteobacteria bacterium]
EDLGKEIRWLAGVEDPDPREGLLREILSTWEPGDLAGLLAALTAGIRGEAHRAVYITLLRVLAWGDPMSTSVREEVYSLAAAMGRRDAVRVLLPVAAAKSLRQGELRLDPQVGDMPLGVQKWRARGRDRDLLEKLSQVPHPDVLRIWLGNPRTLEGDVLRVASSRPAAASCLVEILRSARWAPRARVHEALAQNPYLPSHLAAGLLHLLPPSLMEPVSRTRALHSLVRESARELVERRVASPSQSET